MNLGWWHILRYSEYSDVEGNLEGTIFFLKRVFDFFENSTQICYIPVLEIAYISKTVS